MGIDKFNSLSSSPILMVWLSKVRMHIETMSIVVTTLSILIQIRFQIRFQGGRLRLGMVFPRLSSSPTVLSLIARKCGIQVYKGG